MAYLALFGSLYLTNPSSPPFSIVIFAETNNFILKGINNRTSTDTARCAQEVRVFVWKGCMHIYRHSSHLLLGWWNIPAKAEYEWFDEPWRLEIIVKTPSKVLEYYLGIIRSCSLLNMFHILPRCPGIPGISRKWRLCHTLLRVRVLWLLIELRRRANLNHSYVPILRDLIYFPGFTAPDPRIHFRYQ